MPALALGLPRSQIKSRSTGTDPTETDKVSPSMLSLVRIEDEPHHFWEHANNRIPGQQIALADALEWGKVFN